MNQTFIIYSKITKSMKRTVVGLIEAIELISSKKKVKTRARIDTGATRSSIDISLAAKLHLGPIVEQKTIRSAHGKTIRAVVHATIKLKGKTINETFTLADRRHMTYPVLIGQNILRKSKFLIDPLK